MTATDLLVTRSDLATTSLVPSTVDASDLSDGQAVLAVNRFALTSNNLSYAAAGDLMGYWNFFPAPTADQGRLPVWGYATVEASRHPDLPVGEEVFGFLPTASRFVMSPDSVTATHFSDQHPHRRDLHPWYNRYYRTSADPVSLAGHRDLQPVLWALFMTGWMLAEEFDQNDNFGADVVVVASASSKTAYSFTQSLVSKRPDSQVIGLTSSANLDFVRSLGCYQGGVISYDELDQLPFDRSAALVDMSGNATVVSAVHHGFGERLTESVRIGSTHLGQRGNTDALPGPDRRFFFIPDVAEAAAGTEGFDEFHQRFAAAWSTFAPWAARFTSFSNAGGPQAIQAAYLAALSGSHNPSVGTLLSYP